MNRTVTKRPAQATRARENGHKFHYLAPLFMGFPCKNLLKQKDVAKNTVKYTFSKHHFQHHFCQIHHASVHRPSIVQKPTIPIRRAKETVKINPCEKNKSCELFGTNKTDKINTRLFPTEKYFAQIDSVQNQRAKALGQGEREGRVWNNADMDRTNPIYMVCYAKNRQKHPERESFLEQTLYIWVVETYIYRVL